MNFNFRRCYKYSIFYHLFVVVKAAFFGRHKPILNRITDDYKLFQSIVEDLKKAPLKTAAKKFLPPSQTLHHKC